MRRWLLPVLILLLSGCAGIPEGLQAIDGFDVNRYLGTWYEIARLDHRFERGLEDISATYSLEDDGSLTVLNQGWNVESGEWKKAQGTARLAGRPDEGRLKVSFFGPFYGGYNIIVLDKAAYSYALVAGSDKDSLWILARQKTLPKDILESLVGQAKLWGFATDKLIYTKHSRLAVGLH